MTLRFDPRAGARNLIEECIAARSGESLAIVTEDDGQGYYDRLAADCIEDTAKSLDLQVTRISCRATSGPEDIPEAVARALETQDHVLFMTPLGDQIRFADVAGKASRTMCYALDIGILGSGYATMPHRFMKEVLERFELELETAGEYRLSCPEGTDVRGSLELTAGARKKGTTIGTAFTINLFPQGIFRPLSCGSMSGRVFLSKFLCSTGTHHYEGDTMLLDGPVFAEIEQGRVVDFSGDTKTVERVRMHHYRVSELFGGSPDRVHSWHCGIHPQCFYPLEAVRDINRWGAIAFANPRNTHFHVCGDTPPGEISWQTFDTTIELDGERYWENGRFIYLEKPEIRALADEYRVDPAFLEHRRDIGI